MDRSMIAWIARMIVLVLLYFVLIHAGVDYRKLEYWVCVVLIAVYGTICAYGG